MRDGFLQSSAAPRDRFSTAGGSVAARAAGSGDEDNTPILWPLLDIIFPCCVMNVLKTFILGLQGVAQPGSESSAAAAAWAAAARSIHISLPCSF